MGRHARFVLGVTATAVFSWLALPSQPLRAQDGPLPPITIEEVHRHLVEYRDSIRSSSGSFSMVATFGDDLSPQALASLFSEMWAEWRQDAHGRFFIHCDQLVDGTGAARGSIWRAYDGRQAYRVSQLAEEPRFMHAILNEDGQGLGMEFRSLATPLEMAGLVFHTAPEFALIELIGTGHARIEGQRLIDGAWCYHALTDAMPFVSPAATISAEADLDPGRGFLPRRWTYIVEVEREPEHRVFPLIAYEINDFEQFPNLQGNGVLWFPTDGARHSLSHIAQIHVEDLQINPTFAAGAFVPPIEDGATVRDARTGAAWVQGGALSARQQAFFDRRASEAQAEIDAAVRNPPEGRREFEATPARSQRLALVLSAVGGFLCFGGLWYYVRNFHRRKK